MSTEYLPPIGYTSADTLAPVSASLRLLLGGAIDNSIATLQVANGSNLVFLGEVDSALRVSGVSVLDAGAIATSGTGIFQSVGPLGAIDIPNRQLIASDGSTPNVTWANPGQVFINSTSDDGSGAAVQLTGRTNIGDLTAVSHIVDSNAICEFCAGGNAANVWFTGDSSVCTNLTFYFDLDGTPEASFGYWTTISGFTPATNVLVFDNNNFAAPICIDTSNRFLIGAFSDNGSGAKLQVTGDANVSSLTASTALACDSNKTIVSSATTATELGYVSGVTSAIQTQLNAKQSSASSADVTAQAAANSSIVTLTSPSSGTAHTYQVGGYITVTALTLATVTLQVTWTDETSAVRTASFFGEGLTTAAISTVGAFPFPAMTIRSKSNTAITIKTIATITTSIAYDAGGWIQAIN